MTSSIEKIQIFLILMINFYIFIHTRLIQELKLTNIKEKEQLYLNWILEYRVFGRVH
jgi:hypothetical protein